MKLDSSISAVITGGASGMGEATARLLASYGVKVALFDLNEERGTAVAKDIDGIFCKVDVMSDEAVDAGFEKARAAHGQERILVNCAGGGFGGPAKTVSRDKATGEIKRYNISNYQKTLELNLVGTFRCIVASAAGMLTLDPLEDGDRGAVVNTASVAAQDGQIGQAAYASAKAGIVGLTLVAARDLSNDAIRVNTILPGIFDTPMLGRAPEALKASLGAQVPFPKRLGQVHEYAQLAHMMITNGYLNGESVRLDGAIRMAPR